MKIFCKIINVFTVTFDQFNAFLMNKSINKSIWINFTPNFWLVVYHIFHKNQDDECWSKIQIWSQKNYIFTIWSHRKQLFEMIITFHNIPVYFIYY